MFPSLLQLLEVALNPWFVAPSSNPTTLTPASIVTVPFLTLLTPSFSYKDPCDYQAPLNNPRWFPSLKSLNLIIPATTFAA